MPKRVLIYGVTGSGKTTLAREIAERTGLPWHPVDDLTWEPGWVGVDEEEQRRRMIAICAGERWVLDAAYGSWRDVVMARADLIVGLDYPRWTSLSRLIRRTLRRIATREPVCNGNIESLRNSLATDSIIVWHFRSFANKRARIRKWAADPPGPNVLRLVSPKQARRWLETLDRE